MFVVVGASGNTGSVVARALLSHKLPVRVVLRDDKKAASFREGGAEVALAEIEDVTALARAFQGATSAYLMIPPDSGSHDPIGRGKRIADILAQAVQQARVPHVTLLSSVGAQHESGTGIVRTLHHAEQRLGAAGAGMTAVRAAYFMENWAGVLPVAAGQGVLPSFLEPPERQIPMVATQDIGQVAARAMRAAGTGKRIIELSGPQDHSPQEVAALVSRLLGKPVSLVTVPEPGRVPALVQAGLSQESAEQMAELVAAVNRGHAHFQGGGAEHQRGTTTLEQVISGLLNR